MRKKNESNVKQIVTVILYTTVILYFMLSISTHWFHAYQYKGQWALFDSQDYHHVETFPDNLRFEYPKSWQLITYEKGGRPKPGPDIRIDIRKFTYLLPHTKITVYWRRTDGDWSLTNARDWYLEQIERSVDRNELRTKRDTFENVLIGKGSYSALTQNYEIFNMMSLVENRNKPLKKVVLFIVDDEAFAIVFTTVDSINGSLDVFERMLSSLEVYN